MADGNTPQGTVEQEPVSTQDTADSLLDRFLDGSPQGDTEQAGNEQEAADDAQSEAQTDEADQAEQGTENQPEEPQFATDDAKVRLEDGSEVTISDLKRGSLRQADYTRKTQELAATRKELETRQAALAQQSTQFESQINLAIEIAAANIPAQPDPSMMQSDPFGYMQQKETHERAVQQLNQLVTAKQQHEQAQVAEQQQKFQQYVGNEHQALVEAMPELNDVAKRQAFGADMAQTIKKYGFTDQDMASLYDHRFFLAVRDLIAYQKLQAQKPQAMAKTKGKPPVSSVGNRQSPQGQKSAQKSADWKRLRESGGKDSGAWDRIMDDLI